MFELDLDSDAFDNANWCPKCRKMAVLIYQQTQVVGQCSPDPYRCASCGTFFKLMYDIPVVTKDIQK
jgi:DNA-directed RNA polymerase subunit RPC12/RpoP